MHDDKLSKPRILGQALYMFLLVLHFLATIWRCVHHAPFGRKVDLHVYNLNLKFVFGKGVNQLLHLNILLRKARFVQVLSLHVVDPILA